MHVYHPKTPTPLKQKPRTTPATTSSTDKLEHLVELVLGEPPSVLFSPGGQERTPQAQRQPTPEPPKKDPPVMALPAPEEITKVEPASPAAAEITPPILGFPEKFELAYRYGENRLAKDVEMSDSDRRGPPAPAANTTSRPSAA